MLGLTASENPDVTIKAFQLPNGISSDVVVTDKPRQFNPFPQKRISQSFGPDLNGITAAFHLKGTQYSESGEPKGWLITKDVADKMKEALLDLKKRRHFPQPHFCVITPDFVQL